MFTVYLFTQERGRGERGESEPERRLDGYSSQSWVESINMANYISSLINTCRKVPLQVNIFIWRHFALLSIKLISPCCELSPAFCRRESSVCSSMDSFSTYIFTTVRIVRWAWKTLLDKLVPDQYGCHPVLSNSSLVPHCPHPNQTRVEILSTAMGRGIDSRNRVWN